MTLLERWYFSNRRILHWGKRAMTWADARTDSDETKCTALTRKHAVVKYELVKGVLTFAIHVHVKESGEYIWKYRKYSIVDTRNDNTPLIDGDIVLADPFVVRPGRAGKYGFKK